MDYQDGVVTFNYNREDDTLADRLTSGADSEAFAAIVRKHFGEGVEYNLRRSGG